VTAQGDRAGDTTGSGLVLPGFVKFDALAYYKLSERTKVQLNVYNVFNEKYYERAFGALRVVPGEPLSALVSMKTTF
jgi:iron complex outermembrane receptor protein